MCKKMLFQNPAEEEKVSSKPTTAVKRNLTVRIVEPRDVVVRNDMINPFWIDRVRRFQGWGYITS